MENLMKWLEKEKNKDKLEVEQYKQKIAEQIKKVKKEDILKKKKTTFFEKIKIILWGR